MGRGTARPRAPPAACLLARAIATGAVQSPRPLTAGARLILQAEYAPASCAMSASIASIAPRTDMTLIKTSPT
jgi:hypothetical protein